MYNSNDLEVDVSLSTCFKNVLDLAFELVDTNKVEEADKYFDILRSCLGIDFSIFLNCTDDELNKMLSNDLINYSFEVQLNARINEYTKRMPNKNSKFIKSIQRKAVYQEVEEILSLFPYMVLNGEFNKEYYTYLLERKQTISELAKIDPRFTKTYNLINSRINEVNVNLLVPARN